MSVTQYLALSVSGIIKNHYGIEANISIRSSKIKSYDYQCDIAFQIAKKQQCSPLQIAEDITTHLNKNTSNIESSASAPGFINFIVKPTYLSKILCEQIHKDQTIQASHKKRVIVDYGSPNVAKNMHVGHLRSTVIGDAIARVLDFSGHEVIRQNHLGDWGTQFGMLIEYLKNHKTSLESLDINTLNQAYREAKQQFDTSNHFADKAKDRVVLLQSGDPETIETWKQLVAISIDHFQSCYETLGVLLSREDIRGESFYNDLLQPMIDLLASQGLLQESQGAKVLFLEGFLDKNQQPLPMILQKSDGGFLYATTDLATLQYRSKTLHADRMIYVTDSRQKQHFAMVFAAAKVMGLINEHQELNHVAFGTILGENGKPFKTRSGEVIALDALIAEAKAKALKLFLEKNPDASSDEAIAISGTIAVAALKYADLSVDKIKDVKFNWDKMLAFEGNTAPYLLNAVVRIHSLFKKNGSACHDKIDISHKAEHQLAIKLVEFTQHCQQVAESLEIHHLCHYLYDVTCAFHNFYEHCPIQSAEEPNKSSRLNLCLCTLKVLQQGLNLLGIETLEKM